ncbi:MAG: argininosuccinate lyase [Candidatus Omnitrophica bacterium]|nr:argininosuccinate lyase [Candidatus Omnitrophota bacterium]
MSKKLWGGRFKKKIDKDFEEFSKSVQYDYKLAEYDIYHSIIHVSTLAASKILTPQEAQKLISVLSGILKEIRAGKFKYDPACEDIHSDIQNRVEKKVGELALKLHSLRSRNDQIVFDEKWYCLDQGIDIGKIVTALGIAVVEKAAKSGKDFFIGYTHTQRAQIISFSDYLYAWAEIFLKDCKRLNDFCEGLELVIGAGALTGTALKKEAYQKAAEQFLRADKIKKSWSVLNNALFTISDRDFIVEFLSILSLIQMHLSRMAEDFILYSTKEFDFFDLPEEFCTGSSLMPHKKNPDFLELVRGLTGKIYGNLMAILTTMKGLPLTYNRDMQLDKEPLFSSVETVKEELKIMAKFVKGIKLKKENIKEALKDEQLYATEIAEFLVTKKKVAFKEAHDVVGKLIRYSEDKKKKIEDMDDLVLKTFHPVLKAGDLKKIMTPKYAIDSKKSVSRALPKLKKK